jgi:hypothetical protein
MAIVLPTIGQTNWGTTLNTALTYLDTNKTNVNLSSVGTSIVPTSDNAVALGGSSHRFSNLYLGTGLTFPDGTVQTTAAVPAAILHYGSFEDYTTQTNAGATSANLVSIGSTSTSRGVSLVAGSKVTFANSGAYLFNFLGQFQFSGGASNYNITVWYAKNGTIVSGSASTFTTTSAQASQILANVEDIVDVTAGDYFQFYWWSPATGMTLAPTASGTNPTRPQSASVRINTYNVG